jgi:hypothetical protein
MYRKLASGRISRFIAVLVHVLAIVFAVTWFAAIGYVLLQGSYEVGGLFIVFTILIAALAYANERDS